MTVIWDDVNDHAVTRVEQWKLGNGVTLKITDQEPMLQGGTFIGKRTDVSLETLFGGSTHLGSIDDAYARLNAALGRLADVAAARTEGRPS